MNINVVERNSDFLRKDKGSNDDNFVLSSVYNYKCHSNNDL